MMMDMLTMYEDNPASTLKNCAKRKPSPSMHELKKNFILDFESEPSAKKQKSLMTPAGVISSPDVWKLKLKSPEIESFLFGGSTGLNSSGTPLTPSRVFFPKNVTDEQQVFAQGFTEKLDEIKNGTTTTSCSIGANTNTAVFNISDARIKQEYPEGNLIENRQVFAELRTISNPVQVSGVTTTTNSGYRMQQMPVPTVLQGAPTSPPAHKMPWQDPNNILPMHCRDEESVPSPAMTVETASSWAGTPPLSPLDMDTQEKLKLERKRARNRVAATKCRQRKLDKIQMLEMKVQDLKTQNTDLQMTAERLRNEVHQLRAEIDHHKHAGCHIIQCS